MLKINGKTFMNLQEAVQWLLDNNALPFQCSANYIANTEIGLGTIVNPSPAKVRIGSLIFFADSKVSTVTGLTENGFIVSDQYNDLVDDVVYVSNVALNASNHLIVTLSNGTQIDAGLIKEVSSITINASQHFIVNYNDGTSADLGSLGDYSNVDFIAKTLKQTQPNYENAISVGLSGCTVTDYYSYSKVINGVLYLIANYKAKNTSGTSRTYYALGTCYVNIDSAYADKIVDLAGDKVSQLLGAPKLITMFKALTQLKLM